MAITSITGKQYPSVTQMTGIFGELHRRKMAEEDLERQKKRDKMYGEYLVNQTRLAEQRANLLRTQQEALNTYRNNQQMLEKLRYLQNVEENQRANVKTVMDMVDKRRQARLNNMEPGGSDTDEDVTQDYQFAWQMFDIYGIEPQIRTQVLETLGPLSKPEEKAHIGQVIQGSLQLLDVAPEAAVAKLENTLGIELDSDAIAKLKLKSTRDKIERVDEAYSKGLFETPEDYQLALRNAVGDQLGIYTGAKMRYSHITSPVSASSMQLVQDALRMEFSSKTEAEMAANYSEMTSKQLGEARSFDVVEIEKWGANKWKVVEIPTVPTTVTLPSTPINKGLKGAEKLNPEDFKNMSQEEQFKMLKELGL